MDTPKILITLAIGLPISWFFLPTDWAGWAFILWLGVISWIIIAARMALEDIALKGMGKKWRDDD
jgi:hypothetical protein